MQRERENTLRNISSVAGLRDVFPLVIESDVAWGEMDACQHVNNAVYLRYFENARVTYLNRSGWDAMKEGTGVGIVLKRIEVSYHASLQYPCHVWLAAGVPLSEPRKEDRFSMEYAVGYLDKAGAFCVAATGESEIALISSHATPPEKAHMADEIRQLIESYEARQLPTNGPRWPLIGVVGATSRINQEISDRARETGREIISAGAILVTGGEPAGEVSSSDPKPVKAVKDAAMDGALEAGAHGKQARMIGILPNKGKGAETIKSNPNTRCLLLHTTLSNYQRNCLTGCLADGLIALKGDAGTLSEVGLALEAGKPVVFLDSHAHLRSKLEDPAIMTDLKKILKDVKCIRPAMDTERIIRRLSDMLGDENVSTHATEPANAVQIALGKVASGTAEMASPSRALLGLEERAVSPGEFEKELLSLCKRGSS